MFEKTQQELSAEFKNIPTDTSLVCSTISSGLNKEETLSEQSLKTIPNKCKCGCGREIIVKPYHKYSNIPKFINGHNTRTKEYKNKVGQIIRYKYKGKSFKERFGIEIAREIGEKISIAKKGWKPSEEWRKKNSELRQGKQLPQSVRDKMSKSKKGIKNPMYGKGNKIMGDKNPFYGKTHKEETKRLIGESNKGEKNHWFNKKGVKHNKFKLIKIEDLIDNIKNIFKYQGRFTKSQFNDDKLTKKIVTHNKIFKVLKENNLTLDDLAKLAGVEFLPRNTRWKQKEDLGIELAKEVFNSGRIHPYHKGIGRPDFEPNDVNSPIIDIKSTLNDCSIEQYERYKSIRETKMLIFENKGNTEIEKEDIIFMEDIIRELPLEKRRIFEDRYNQILYNISNEQKNLIS